jgi:hypothetical protein
MISACVSFYRIMFVNARQDGEGSVVLIMQEEEDAWHCFNLIAVRDTLKASTSRAVCASHALVDCW